MDSRTVLVAEPDLFHSAPALGRRWAADSWELDVCPLSISPVSGAGIN